MAHLYCGTEQFWCCAAMKRLLQNGAGYPAFELSVEQVTRLRRLSSAINEQLVPMTEMQYSVKC